VFGDSEEIGPRLGSGKLGQRWKTRDLPKPHSEGVMLALCSIMCLGTGSFLWFSTSIVTRCLKVVLVVPVTKGWLEGGMVNNRIAAFAEWYGSELIMGSIIQAT
jgi:hypothetical protein